MSKADSALTFGFGITTLFCIAFLGFKAGWFDILESSTLISFWEWSGESSIEESGRGEEITEWHWIAFNNGFGSIKGGNLSNVLRLILFLWRGCCLLTQKSAPKSTILVFVIF